MERIYMICILFVFVSNTYGNNRKLNCEPRLRIVSTEQNGEFYSPFRVEVHRCDGGVKQPSHYHCVAKNSTKVYFILTNSDINKKENIPIVNHTSCVEKCVCKCPGETHTPDCPSEMSWDQKACMCKAEQSKTECATGRTEGKGQISVVMFVVSLFIELVAVLIIVFLVVDACKYKKHSEGVIYRTTQFVRQISSGENEGFRCNTLKRERDTSGSVTLLYDIRNGNVPNGKADI